MSKSINQTFARFVHASKTSNISQFSSIDLAKVRILVLKVYECRRLSILVVVLSLLMEQITTHFNQSDTLATILS